MAIEYIKVFISLLRRGEYKQLYQRVKGKLQRIKLRQKAVKLDAKNASANDCIYILATKHTLYVSELIKHTLMKLGKENIVILDPETTTFADGLHFVVCPQMFKKLPRLYIAFQMEQSVSSRWFTKEYFSTLEKAMAIMDYSKTNIQYLQETGGLHYKQIFWTPISNIPNFKNKSINQIPQDQKPYDIVFYGDPNNERRQNFLAYLKKYFKVLVVSEVFGEPLYEALNQGKVVVNIHYYENALLETTRIYECLSLGLPVISESSIDIDDHKKLEQQVTFTEIGDMSAMKRAIEQVLTQNEPRPELADDLENFEYYLSRMLMAINLLPMEPEKQIPDFFAPDDLKKRVTLTLPETFERHKYIQNVFPENTLFSGLRHFDGWLGAASSFKYLATQAKKNGIKTLEVCEDDVEINEDFERSYTIVNEFLFDKLAPTSWDVFCGIIADVHDDAEIRNVYHYRGMTFIELDKMTSMVFNIYNSKAIDLLSNWDATNHDVHTNTIDRYIEKQPIKVITTSPYLVSHLPEHTSSIWHFNNSTYDDLINISREKLDTKVQQFLKSNRATEII